MKLFFTILLLSFGAIASAQKDYLKIEKESEGEFHFPIIHSKNKIVEEKINVHLQLGELNCVKGKEKHSIFEEISRDKSADHIVKSSIDFSILQNTERNLSLRLYQSSCNEKCDYWVTYHNFNPQNGDRYVLSDFFEEESYSTFRTIVSEKRIHELQTQITELKKTVKSAKYLEEYIYTDIISDNLESFYFTEDSIYFDNENLIADADKFLELNHITAISIESIDSLLNNFGKVVFLTGRNLKNFRSISEPQLYEGVIDNSTTFYFLYKKDIDDTYLGTCMYKKKGKRTSLIGTLTESEFTFMEYSEDAEESNTITFKKAGHFLIGRYKGKDGKFVLFKATRL